MLQGNSSYETVFLQCCGEENIGTCKSMETSKDQTNNLWMWKFMYLKKNNNILLLF